MSGFITMQREALNHPVIGTPERFYAWFWLVAHAAWKPTRTRVKGATVILERGELSFSQRFLAESWGWSKSRVDRFISDLRAESMIATRSKIGATAGHLAGQGQAIITICNYDKYQTVKEAARGNDEHEIGATAGQQRGKEEQRNKGKKEEEPPIVPQHTTMRDWPDIPDWIPVEPWNAFIDMRRRKSGMPTPRAIELMVGKLDRWKANGHDPGDVLDQSTENQWTGIFEIKQERVGNGTDRRGGAASGDGFIRALDRKLAEHANGSGLGQAASEVGTAGHRLALVDQQGSRTS